jgi:hypothetical protein
LFIKKALNISESKLYKIPHPLAKDSLKYPKNLEPSFHFLMPKFEDSSYSK